MKKLKVSMVAVIAVIIAVAGSAFTMKHAPTKGTTLYYFKYNPDTRTGLTVASNWTSVDGPSSACSNDQGVNCVMHLSVPPDGDNPDFSAAGITSDAQIDALTDTYKDE